VTIRVEPPAQSNEKEARKGDIGEWEEGGGEARRRECVERERLN